jgi:amino acid transporter
VVSGDPASAVTGGELGLRELIAIGVGGMIGGGIFSVLGLAVDLSGPGVPFAFALGAVVALTAGYSYVRLALTFRVNGASYTYLRRAYPRRPRVAAAAGWTVTVGYVGTLSLYAFTFGAYGADLAGHGGSRWLRVALSATVLVALALVNAAGVRSTGLVEDVLVYGKIALLGVLATAGLFGSDVQHQPPVFHEGVTSILMTGALIFVAFEGFQLIANTIENTRDPERNVPIGIYSSIVITTILYILLAVVALRNLSIPELLAAKEYTLSRAAEPVLGAVGRDLVAVAALLATSSAINSTVLGSSQMTAEMGDDGTMPTPMARRSSNVPRVAIVVITAFALGLTLLGSLEFIATFSSVTFLLVTGAVGIANFHLRAQTRARPILVGAGVTLTGATLLTLVVYLAQNEPWALVGLVAFFALTAAAAAFTTRRQRG